MRRRQLPRALVDRPRLGDVPEGKVLFHRQWIDVPRHGSVRHQRLELGSEQQLPIGQQRVVKRLYPEAVAREKQRLRLLVPQREGEHAAEALHARLAPLLPRVNDDFGVAARMEPVTGGREFRDQRLIVVDLAVEDDADRAVLVVQRLLARREIDDRESAVPESDARREVHSAFVRAAVMLRLVHASEHRALDRALSKSCRRFR